jgi:hypothetical protein|tara:strand:- start:5151 stop:6842 length:1692 start_codon:yes stop_codon:yes gene_type:complete
MGADNSLVRASFSLGASEAAVTTPNMKPLYEANTSNLKKSLGIITGVMDKLKKEEDELMAGKELASKRLKNVMNVGMKKIHGLKEPLPQVIVQAIRDDIKRLQEEFETVNTYGKNDTEDNNNARNRIEGELSKIINTATDWRGGIGILAAGKDSLDLESIDYGDLDPATMALDVENMDKNAAAGLLTARIVNGEITLNVSKYSTRTIRVPLSDPSEQFLTADSDGMMDQEEKFGVPKDLTMKTLKEQLTIKDVTWDAGEVKVHNEMQKRVKQDFSDGVNNFDLDEESSQIAGTIKTEDDFKNIAKRNIEGLGLNFKRSLLQSGLMQREIMGSMFLDGEGKTQEMSAIFDMLDMDGDGDVDADDNDIVDGDATYTAGPRAGTTIDKELWLKNSRVMLDAITNTKAKGFDLGVSTKLISDYFATMREQKYNEDYNKLQEAKNKDEFVEKQTASNTIGGTQGIWSVERNEFVKNKYFSQSNLDVKAQLTLMDAGKEFRDHLGQKWIQGGDGKFTGVYPGPNKEPMMEWDDELNDGDGGYGNKKVSFTKKQILDLMFGISDSNRDIG